MFCEAYVPFYPSSSTAEFFGEAIRSGDKLVAADLDILANNNRVYEDICSID